MKGSVVLVTGAGRGIGRAIALRFAREGARLALAARTAAEVEETARACREAGCAAIGIPADVSLPPDVRGFAEAARREFGGIDVLVNNAGVQGPIGPAAESDPEAWIRTVSVNLVGTYLCAREVIPDMLRSGGGRIVAMSGGGAVGPRPNFSSYAASKAGVVRLVDTLARELEGTGVLVNAVAPGAIHTRMTEEIIAAGERDAGGEYESALALRKRNDEDLRNVCDCILFLAGPESAGITGKLISARYDPWRTEAFRELLRAGDALCTMRRIDHQYYKYP